MNKWEISEDEQEEKQHRADDQFTKVYRSVGLHVCVEEAKGLPHTDWWPKDTRPDGYLRIYLLGEDDDDDDHEQSCQSPALHFAPPCLQLPNNFLHLILV